MDKYAEQLSLLPNDFLHIARSFAVDNSSPKVEPAHILRALLHKSAGLVDFIENTLDSDYYYLLDWTDIRMGQAPKSAYPMKDFVLSDEARSVVREAMTTSRSLGSETLDIRALLAAVVTPGVGFSADQLKTMPLSHTAVLAAIGGNAPAQHPPARRPQLPPEPIPTTPCSPTKSPTTPSWASTTSCAA